jgi:site-specific recombinase XerC
MSRQWARRVIALTARNLSIDEVGAHSMRKIYACNIFRSTGDLEAVRVALNHSKVETTLIYLRDVLPAGR